MLALYRSGRQADALDLYRRTRELFVDELGIEPGPVLQELEQAILRQDSDLRLPAPPPVAAPQAPPPSPRRRRLLYVLAVLGAAAVAAASIVAFLRSGGDHRTPPPQGSSELRAFVFKVEVFLGQSKDGRISVTRTIDRALHCRISPAAATDALDGVQRNRQSLLDQIAALHVPPGEEALRASDLLQKATAASIAADFVYRDWLRAKDTCKELGRPPAAALAADARATKLKQRFLVAFDPLARRFHKHVWKAGEF
jgi:hypothetical protein